MHAGIEHHYVFVRISVRGKQFVQFGEPRRLVFRVYEGIVHSTVGIMFGDIVKKTRSSRDRRVGQPPLVPLYPYYVYPFYFPLQGKDVGTQITALIHRHAVIGEIVVFLDFRIDIHVRHAHRMQFLGELQGLVPEHRGYHDP